MNRDQVLIPILLRFSQDYLNELIMRNYFDIKRILKNDVKGWINN